MSAQAVEILLARIYTDPAALERFLMAPVAEALAVGCSPEEAARLAPPDALGLRLAGESFRRKRSLQPCQSPKRGWWRVLSR